MAGERTEQQAAEGHDGLEGHRVHAQHAAPHAGIGHALQDGVGGAHLDGQAQADEDHEEQAQRHTAAVGQADQRQAGHAAQGRRDEGQTLDRFAARHIEGAGQGPDPREGEHQALGAGVAFQHIPREDGDDRAVAHREKHEHTQVGDQPADRQAAPGIAPACPDLGQDGRPAGFEGRIADPDGQQRGDHRQIGYGVDQKADALSEGHDHRPADGGPHQAGGIEHGGVGGDGVGQQAALGNQVQHEILPEGRVNALHDPLPQRQHDQRPPALRVDVSAQHARGQQAGLQHEEGLREDQGFAPVPAVRPGPGEGTHEQRGDHAQKSDQTQQEC